MDYSIECFAIFFKQSQTEPAALFGFFKIVNETTVPSISVILKKLLESV